MTSVSWYGMMAGSHMIVIYRPACQTSCKAFILFCYRDRNNYICGGHEDDDQASVDLDVVTCAKKVFSANEEGTMPYHIIL